MSSYVTRRLLRSTLPEAAPEAGENAPKVRPKLHTKSGGSPSKPSKKQSKRRPEEAEAVSENHAAGENRMSDTEDDPDDVRRLHGFELLIDVNFEKDRWAEARILDLDPKKQRLFVHYMGWNARYDNWITPKIIEAHGSRTGAVAKKMTSWDGEQSLFANVGAPKKSCSKQKSPRLRHIKVNTEKRKRSSSTSAKPASPRAPRKQEDVANDVQPVKVEPVVDEEQDSPAVRRSTRARVRKDSGSEATEAKSTAARLPTPTGGPPSRIKAEKVPSAVADETPVDDHQDRKVPVKVPAKAKRSTRRRGKNEDQSSASEYSDHEDSEEEEDDDASDDDELRRLRKRRKQREEVEKSSTKTAASVNQRPVRNAVGATAVPPPNDVHIAGGAGAMRERLAAIFRQRVYEQQLLQVTQSQLQTASLQSQVAQAASTAGLSMAQPSDGTSSAATEARAAEVVSNATTPAVAAGKMKAQAAAHGYPGFVMLPNGTMAVTNGNNKAIATVPVFGATPFRDGDPRLMQARTRALEHQRQLKRQQVQEYYRCMNAARAQNVESMAATQDFMSKSADAWLQLAKDGTSVDEAGAKTWKEMTSSFDSKDKQSSVESSSSSPVRADASARELVRSVNPSCDEAPGDSSSDRDGKIAPASCAMDQAPGAGRDDASALMEADANLPPDEILYEFVL